MSDPELWTTKDPNTVQVKYTGVYGENMTDVTDWVQSLAPEDSNMIVFPQGNVLITYGNFEMPITVNQYVYLDEDGFHSVGKGSFEMVYKKNLPA
jgi:hypothetical protein